MKLKKFLVQFLILIICLFSSLLVSNVIFNQLQSLNYQLFISLFKLLTISYLVLVVGFKDFDFKNYVIISLLTAEFSGICVSVFGVNLDYCILLFILSKLLFICLLIHNFFKNRLRSLYQFTYVICELFLLISVYLVLNQNMSLVQYSGIYLFSLALLLILIFRIRN